MHTEGTDFTDGMFQVNYTAGNGSGDRTCVDYPTTSDDVAEGDEIFILDIVSLDAARLIPEMNFNTTVVQIMDNDRTFSSVRTQISQIDMLVG